MSHNKTIRACSILAHRNQHVNQKNHTSTNKTKSRTSLLPNQIFPKAIRDEIRMTVALRGCSSLRQGEGMTVKKQEQCLENFYHGVPNKSPSQIQMISEGLSPCDDLCETKTVSIVT